MKKLFIAIAVLTCLAGTCRKNPFAENRYSIWLKDEQGKGFIFLVSKQYPDTSIPDAYNELAGVQANSRTPYDFHEDKWSDVFENLPADTLSIFIFSGDTLVKYDWQEVRNGYKILKRYDLSQQDIERRNNTITYP